ncbi:MAG: MarC family protein [Chloroflexi bacterium]|nr:MarC family protein [Chloroflexota bacterium]
MSAVTDFLRDLALSFIPLFVAVDALGILPFVLSLTQEQTAVERNRVLRYAMFTAFVLGLGFIVVGRGIFFILGVEVADFLVAGGVVLFVLSIRHFTTGKIVELQPNAGREVIGVVPIGTPLVVGPAVLTTLLLLTQQYQFFAVLLAFLLNLALGWLVFSQASNIARAMREPGLRATSQIASLLLAVIGVMMVRRGLLQILG